MTAIIIVFNTDRFLTEQIRLLQKHVTEKIAVVDNSSDYEIAGKLKALCEENKIEYLKTFCDESDFSKSHAYACTIAINFFREKDSEILLLDHDIFPIAPFEKPSEEIILAGIPQLRKSPAMVGTERILFTYLWPGLLYINTLALEGVEINVKPCVVADTFLDTGGGLYKLIVGNPERVKYFNEQHQETEHGIYSLIDGKWMHLINGSGWKSEPNHEERVNKFMSVLYANS